VLGGAFPTSSVRPVCCAITSCLALFSLLTSAFLLLWGGISHLLSGIAGGEEHVTARLPSSALACRRCLCQHDASNGRWNAALRCGLYCLAAVPAATTLCIAAMTERRGAGCR